MYWLLLAQPGEIQADRVLLKKTRPRDIDFVDRDGCDFSCNIQLHRIGAHASSSIPDKQTRLAFKPIAVSQDVVNKAYKDCCAIGSGCKFHRLMLEIGRASGRERVCQ